MQIGELVGRGRTSDVHAYGLDSVVKVPHRDVPDDWPEFEAKLAKAVCEKGVPAPEVRDVITVDGRTSVVFERVGGPSMWQQMVAQPGEATALARELAAIHKALLAVGIAPGLPDFVDRLVRKIGAASALPDDDRAEAMALSEQLPRGAALLHGDLHPGNVLMGAGGPVVIDWFDAAIGHPVADIVRSSLLMQPSEIAAPRHLPNAPRELLHQVHQTYMAEFAGELAAVQHEQATWQAVIAAGRLAEGAEVNERGLVALWEARVKRPSQP